MIEFPSGLHIHTVWGDGKNTPEEMILAAVAAGFESVGISEHAYAPYDTVCIPKDKMDGYRGEVFSLKEKYRGTIEVYAGIEVDFHCLYDKDQWDFVIGSVHYVRGRKQWDRAIGPESCACGVSGDYYPIDYTEESILKAIADIGSARYLVQDYCESVAVLAESYRPDILGHIDVITKLNAKYPFFDEQSGWYLSLWEGLIGRIAATGVIVELNSGAVSRGWRDAPYPAPELIEMLRKKNVPVTISSDAHRADDIDCAYPAILDALRKAGYSSVKMLKGGRFCDYGI